VVDVEDEAIETRVRSLTLPERAETFVAAGNGELEEAAAKGPRSNREVYV
jgi:hypothetical protein